MKWIMSDFPIENDEGGMSTIRSFSCSNCHYVVPTIHSVCPGCGEEIDNDTEAVVGWGVWNSRGLDDTIRKDNTGSTENGYSKDCVIHILRNVKDYTYVCDLCGNVIFPGITFNNKCGTKDVTIEITQQTSAVVGGLGNRIIKDGVCDNCLRRMMRRSSDGKSET